MANEFRSHDKGLQAYRFLDESSPVFRNPPESTSVEEAYGRRPMTPVKTPTEDPARQSQSPLPRTLP